MRALTVPGARRAAVLALSLCGLLLTAGSAAALPGPALQTDPALLARALTCGGPDLRTAAKPPVLLVHGTFVTEAVWRHGSYEALQAAGYPTCLVRVANRELGDVQGSVEYVVAAIRAVAARAGRPIAVIGHSQGAFLSAMALRYWPDLAGDVQDFVGLSGVYDNGTTLADRLCSVPCAAAGRQLRPGSALLRALGHRPLYAGIDVTAVSTMTDEVVTPQPRGGLLSGARQVAVQDVCPGRYVEHGAMTSDAVAIALARDAIDHPGPADPARIDPSVCRQLTVPGTSATKTLSDGADLAPGVAGFFAQAVSAEPPVRCVFDPACPKPRRRPRLGAALAHPRGRPGTVTARGTLTLPPEAIDRCSGEVQVTITRGGHLVSRRRTAVSPDCRYTSTARLGRAAYAPASRLRVAVAYAGDRELTPVAAAALTFTVPR